LLAWMPPVLHCPRYANWDWWLLSPSIRCELLDMLWWGILCFSTWAARRRCSCHLIRPPPWCICCLDLTWSGAKHSVQLIRWSVQLFYGWADARYYWSWCAK
jgi:hypothetical protein